MSEPILYGILSLSAVAAIILLIVGYLSPRKTSTVVNPPCSATVSKNLDSFPCCCHNGSLTGNLYDADNDWVLSPGQAVSYISICTGYCSSIEDNICYGDTVRYSNCITLLQPQRCQGQAMPIGQSQGEAYYVSALGKQRCESTVNSTHPCHGTC